MFSHPKVFLGAAFQFTQPRYHRLVVLSDPAKYNGEIVFVKLTTLRDSWVDDVCILDAPDYQELTHKTTVAYSTAVKGPAEGLVSLLDDGFIREISPPPPETLNKILAGARVTFELPKVKLDLIEQPT